MNGSSHLRSIGYDASTRTLEIEFRRGGIRQYLAVLVHVYEGLLNAPSGRHNFSSFADSRYRFIRMN